MPPGLSRLIRTAGLCFGTLFCGAGATAQSLYGCSGLEHSAHPAFEGHDGVFFRIDPDLLTHNRLPDGVITQIRALSIALAERGTKLIVVPLPTKALLMPEQLGPEAVKFGYDPDLALTIYNETMQRLRDAEINAVDLRQPLTDIEDPIFATDPRFTDAGAYGVATAIMQYLPAIESPRFTTTFVDDAELESFDRIDLQTKCQAPLPKPSVLVAEMRAKQTETKSLQVTLVGSWLLLDPTLNFANMMGDLTNADVKTYSAETATSALSLALTNGRFVPPDYLIWALPIWENPSLGGDQPIRESVAAAINSCSILESEFDGSNRVVASVAGARGSEFSVLADFGDAKLSQVTFHFYSASDQRRSRKVWRATKMETNRVFMPMTGLWPEGPERVEVEADFDEKTAPQIALCRG